MKPKLRVVSNQFAEIGFTSFGPIFNVGMAFFVENRDIIIDGIELSLRHEDGESRTFRWAGLGETISEITDATGNKHIVSRDQSPIAIKVVTHSLLEKFVRFQEPRYHDADSPNTLKLVSHFNFLKQTTPTSFVQDVLQSKEFFAAIEHRKKWFWWKVGRYEVTLKATSPQTFQLVGSSFSFHLQDVDIDMLTRNLSFIELELRNLVSSNLTDYQVQNFSWQWANVKMLRGSDGP